MTISAWIAAGLLFASSPGVAATPNQCNEQLDEKEKTVALSADGKTKWIDGSQLPLEGHPYADTARPYQRIPDRLKAVTNVNIGVWKQGACSSGMLFRFHVAKSSQLRVRWSVVYKELHSRNMSPRCKSGVDFYSWDAKAREWHFAMSAHPTQKDDNEYEFWVPTSGDVMLYLPCYNGTTKFAVGVDPKAEITPVAHRKYGISKPIVFYGTSITQGGCTSRNALAYPAVVSRRLDAPHVNLGFAGNGRMEIAMADLLLEIDASAYVLDCLWNMDDRLVERNFEPFLRKLKAARPDVPLLTVEMCVVENKPNKKSQFVRGVVEKLKKEDPAKWANLHHLPAEVLFPPDYEGTVDRCHPNDLGMMKMSDEMVKVLKPVLANGGRKPLKVLAIGNSYAACLLKKMPQVAADMGVTLDLLVANIGGCSLEKHVRLMENPKLDPHARPWYCGYSYADGDRPNLPNENWNYLRDAILADDWDVITVQQASPDSWRPESYHPWGDNLVGRVRALCPKAEIVVQETWSDHPGSGRLSKWQLTAEEMYARLHAAYADFAKPYGFRIIPTGAAVEKARTFGMMQKTVHDPHLNPTGDFLQGLVWTEFLFGVDVTKGTYVPEGMDAELAKNLRAVAHETVAATFRTDLSAKISQTASKGR